MSLSFERNPQLVQRILQGVSLSGASIEDIGVATMDGCQLNMLAREVPAPRSRSIELVGFFTPSSLGVQGLPEHLDNRARLEELPHDLQHIDRVGKGVGARLYNGIPSLNSWLDKSPAGLYGVTIGSLSDTRLASDARLWGKARRMASHALKQGRVSKLGRLVDEDALQTVVDEVHAVYGSTDAALLSVPPRAALRQKYQRHHPDFEDWPGTFAVVRKNLRLRRLGIVVNDGYDSL